MNRFHLIAILLVCGLTFAGCHKQKDPVTLAKKELTVEKDEGFCASHDFPNNTWTFPKKELKNGDIMIDKHIKIKGLIPDHQKTYDLSVIVDFLPEIDSQVIPIELATISPDGKSKQTCTMKIDFSENKLVKDVTLPDGTNCKRYSKTIYSQKKFPASGEYTFDIYSKHSKLTLYGIKSIHLKLVENDIK